MQVIALILQGLVALGFTINGCLKLANIGPSVQHFAHFRYARWFMVVVGGLELLAGVGMALGFWFALLVPLAALLLVIVMLGALFTHFVRARDSIGQAGPALVGLLIALALVVMRWSAL